MDQDSFRRLLHTPRTPSQPTSTPAQPQSKDATSKPAFQPRKVKGQDTVGVGYRDRAAERRRGEGNDYAQVEAVLEDFEKRAKEAEDKETFERRRRYLGGDPEHTVLVKGLDMALLEQNKAREAQSTTEEDDALERAFQEGSAVKKKSTREELLRKLKETRQQEQSPQQNSEGAFEEAKKAGKFKPIGFKAPGEEKIKKKKIKAQDGQDKKKKKKKKKQEIEASPTNAAAQTEEANRTVMQPPPQPTSSSSQIDPQPEPDPDAEFDIFAGVGDYEGIDLSDENDEPAEVSKDKDEASPIEGEKGMTKPNWFEEEADIPVREPTPPDEDVAKQATMRQEGGDDRSDEDRPQGLVPLASSAIPSIRDFLAVEGTAEKYEKKRKKKDKTKAGGGGKKKSAEAKVESDYKRLKSYTERGVRD